nr:restriction endonuclease subunit S [Methanobrevibacter smithii]
MNSAAKDYDGFNKYIRITDISETSNKFIPNPLTSPDGDLEDKYKLKKGDIVFARTGASTGKTYLYDDNDRNLYFAGFLIKFHIDNADPKFIFYNTLKEEYLNWVSVMSVRSGQPGINSNEYKKLPIILPSLDEQNKISNFLTSIDKKIDLLERKHQFYQEFKKFLMQQIFTQKLRFNFTDDWNYMNFSEIFKSVSTKKYQIKSADILDKGDFEVIDQGQDEIAGYFNDKTKLCQELPIIIYGDHTTFVKFRDKPFIVGADGVKLLIPKFNANPKYLFYALEHFNIKPEGYKRHFSIIKKIKLPIPTLEEQNEISEIFTYIDIKLKYTKIQLQETEEFKKGLLQQMFIVRINWRCNFKLAKSPSFNKHLLILKNKIIFIIIE